METKCKFCRHWRANKRQPTPLEAWEADPRPERPRGFIGALRGLYNPQQFRGRKPGSGDTYADLDELITASIKVANESGHCRRFPQSRRTHRDYGCGEFQSN